MNSPMIRFGIPPIARIRQAPAWVLARERARRARARPQRRGPPQVRDSKKGRVGYSKVKFGKIDGSIDRIIW